jgi:hypothetical protein
VVGATVHDSATLSGASANAGGTVTYTVYTDAACSAGAVAAGTKPVTNAIVTDSNGVLFSSPGTYNWQAVYSGDANNNAATSTCQTETLVVNKATPNISTIPSAGGLIGTVLNDTATLTGGSAPTGNVTFNLFAPSDATCAGVPAFTETDTLAPYATTIGFPSNAAGIWRWMAVYAGDANNNGATSGCQAEQVTVTAPPPPPAPGRMTGGGSVFKADGTRITHGFELHCDAAVGPNNLEVNWPGDGKGKKSENNFHLESLTSALCTDDPTIDQGNPPTANFDTYTGVGVGRLNGVSGYNATWVFTDAGEPGKNDMMTITIKDPTNTTTLLTVSGKLKNGNHQAH